MKKFGLSTIRIRSLDVIFCLSFITFAAVSTCAQAVVIVDAPTVTPQAAIISTLVYNGNTSASSITGQSTLTTGGVSATATGAVQPSPNETASASVVGGGSSSASSTVEYYFGVNGISPVPTGTTVNVVITASGSVTLPLASINSAQLYFGTPTGTSLLASACGPSGGNSCSASSLANQLSFSIATPETLVVGQQYGLTLDLFVNANTLGGPGSDIQSGNIDPVISFENLSDAGLYDLVFSPGTGNISAVPEPSTWAMMILGFAGVGFVAYRQKAKPTLLAA
jgi:PEP-CTERM motif